MRKLMRLTVVLAVLGVCAPSYGYILVYNVTGGMKALEWNTSKIISISVKGCLVADINSNSNGDNEVNDAQMVLCGKDTGGNLVYYKDSLNKSDEGASLYTTGNVVGVDVWDHNSPFWYEFTMIGNIKATDVGLGANYKEWAASSLSGSLGSWWDQLLDSSQELFGTGAATMTLDTTHTKAANAGSLSVDSVISAFIDGLKAKGYHSIVLPD
ncbi:MAG: hypothetical protein WBL85_00125 [Sedimentisphaerales bacterium]